MPVQSLDFRFLHSDVKRQRELAQEALAEAVRIDEILKADQAGSDHAELEKAKKKFLEMANALAENAIRTSTSGSTTITVLTDLAPNILK